MQGEMQGEIHGEVRAPRKTKSARELLEGLTRYMQVAADRMRDQYSVAFIDELIAAVSEHQRCLLTGEPREVPKNLIIGQAFYDRLLFPLFNGAGPQQVRVALELFEANLSIERRRLIQKSRREARAPGGGVTVTMTSSELDGVFATVAREVRRS